MDIRFWKKKKDQPSKKAVQKYVDAKISFLDLVQSYDGSKTNMTVGFGTTKDLRNFDLRMLQFRSLQLSRENGFASAILGLLETKIINSGLKMRANPLEAILKDLVSSDYLQEFSNKVEALWTVWSKDKRLITVKKEQTLAELERTIYRTAKLSGDCLVIKMINKQGLPVIDIIDGINVVSPALADGKDIVHGVEHNEKGQEIAFWYIDKAGVAKRVKAYTPSGERRAWLVRATEKRIDERRGLPLLSVVMQNINELGKYLDSEQRAALVNSYVAVVHKKDANQPLKADPFSKAAKEATTAENADGGDTSFKKLEPGYFATKLAAGETIGSFDTSRPNVNFGKFFETVAKQMSYSLTIPPECLFLEFNSNYSASRQAKLEFEDLAKKEHSIFTAKFSQPLYESWLDGMILTNRIKAPGYIKAMRDLNNFDIVGAWRAAKWRGLPKSNVDGLKQVKELEIAEDRGYLTADQIADEYYNSDWEQNMRQKKREAEKKREILEILGEFENTKDEIKQFTKEIKSLKDTFQEIKDLQQESA